MTDLEPMFFHTPENPTNVHSSELSRNEKPILSSKEGATYTKQLSPTERHNFKLIDRYREELAHSAPAVTFPLVLSCTESNVCTMTSPAHFHHAHLYGHSRETYASVLSGLEVLRNTLSPKDFPQYVDPDETQSFFSFVETALTDVAPYFSQSKELLALLKNLQPRITEIPAYPSHGDAHNHNWSVAFLNDQPVVSFIDLETLGLYRVGWDEGRMYTVLSGHPDDQHNLLQAIYNQPWFKTDQQLYFWRTVVVRCLRMMQLIIQHKSYTHLNDIDKSQRITTYLSSLQFAINELQKVL